MSSTVTTSPALIDFRVNSYGIVTTGKSWSLRKSTSVSARPGQMATHFSQASHSSPTNSGSPITSSPSIRMACFEQTDVQGLQGISWAQWKTGKQPCSAAGMSSRMVMPGRDLSTSAVRCHSGGTSPTSRPIARAISSPRIRPVNIAADASAISSASPQA